MTNILIVDDDPAVRAGLALLARACGWSAHPFESGEALLRAMDRSKTLREESACMLLDLQMPGLTGPDVQLALRERHISIPIVVVTAYAEHPLAERARLLGAIAVLRKPLQTDQLRDVVHRAMHARDSGCGLQGLSVDH